MRACETPKNPGFGSDTKLMKSQSQNVQTVDSSFFAIPSL